MGLKTVWGGKFYLLAAGLILTCATAFADTNDAPPANASETVTAPSLWNQIQDKAALTYFGIYRGASVNNPGAAYQPTTTGALDPTNPQDLESYVTTGYKINPDLMVGVTTHFFYTPLSMGISTANSDNLEMLDPSLVISKANLIDWNGIKVKGLFYVELPVSKFDILQQHGQATSLSPTVVVSYDVPHTKLSLGYYGYITGYLGGTDQDTGSYRSYKIYGAPNASYQLTDTLSATMWVDLLQITRNSGTGFVSGMSNYTMDIEPGINWEFIKNFNFNPIVNIYPGNASLAATSFQAVIIGKFF